MAKARVATGPMGEQYLVFHCPGCDSIHAPRVTGHKSWRWNGSFDAPTIAPAISAVLTSDDVCHVVIVEGNAHVLNGSRRNAGKVLPLPPIR